MPRGDPMDLELEYHTYEIDIIQQMILTAAHVSQD